MESEGRTAATTDGKEDGQSTMSQGRWAQSGLWTDKTGWARIDEPGTMGPGPVCGPTKRDGHSSMSWSTRKTKKDATAYK